MEVAAALHTLYLASQSCMSEGPFTWSVSYLILGEPVLYE